MGECNAQIAFVGNMGMRVTLRQRGRKDYALLNANGWCTFLLLLMLLRFFCLINAYKMFLCIFFLFSVINFFGGFSRLVLVLQMWSVLVFRCAK